MEVELKPSAGQWLTSGFAVGQDLGAIQINDLTGTTDLGLKVASADGGVLVLDAVTNDDEKQYRIEIKNSPEPVLSMMPAESSDSSTLGSLSTVLFFRIELSLRTDEPIFSPPGGSYDLAIRLVSLPRRTSVRETAFSVERVQQLD